MIIFNYISVIKSKANNTHGVRSKEKAKEDK